MARRALAGLVEALAEVDEEMTDAFLREQEFTLDTLRAAIHRQTLAGRFVPVLGGSAFKHVGVPALLDAVVAYLPNPLNRPPAGGEQPDTGSAVMLPADPQGPAYALAFKLWSDRHKSRLVYLPQLHPDSRAAERVLGSELQSSCARILALVKGRFAPELEHVPRLLPVEYPVLYKR